MASSSSLHINLTTFLRPTRLHSPPKPKPSFTVRCGPRDKRGPLVKGRVLSIEAIQAVQALKRGSHKSDPSLVSKTLSRLIKSDLVAALKELLRQDQCYLALQAFSVFRSEFRADVSLYAEVTLTLARNGMKEEIDIIVCEMDKGVGGCNLGEEDDKGTARLIRAVVEAERRESTVRIYEMLKRNGWGSQEFKADEYVVKVLGKGLRRLGEVELADEVDAKFGSQLLIQS